MVLGRGIAHLREHRRRPRRAGGSIATASSATTPSRNGLRPVDVIGLAALRRRRRRHAQLRN